MFDVSGKSAIITGSAQGLGKQYAIHLLQEGAKVCISDVNEKLGQETVAELGKKFGKDKVIFVKCDVTQEEQLRQLWEEAASKLGYISVLINNAGVNFAPGWKRSVDIMLLGVVHGMQLAREKMDKSKGGQGGRIINTASIAGLSGFPSALTECMGYTMSKWAVVGLTRNFGMAKPDLFESEGIKCYALCPWYTDTTLVTDMMNLKTIEKHSGIRVMDPSEVGKALLDAIRMDSNGAIIPIFPDAPIMALPNLNSIVLVALPTLGKVLKALNWKVSTVNGNLFLGGCFLLAFLALYLAWSLVSLFF